MELEIKVDPKQINEYVAQQIIESALGERLHETVKEALKQLGSYGNDPLKSAVQDEVNKQIRELVRTEFAETIAAAVREKLTDEFISNLVQNFVEKLIAQVDKRY